MPRVEFLGLISPFAHPDVQVVLAAPERSMQDRREKTLVRRELTRQERNRQMQGFARLQGHSTLTIGTAHGLSQNYVWGPTTWTVEMDAHDVEILMSMHPAHQQAFRVQADILLLRSA